MLISGKPVNYNTVMSVSDRRDNPNTLNRSGVYIYNFRIITLEHCFMKFDVRNDERTIISGCSNIHLKH